jgi:hypothetical protein
MVVKFVHGLFGLLWMHHDASSAYNPSHVLIRLIYVRAHKNKVHFNIFLSEAIRLVLLIPLRDLRAWFQIACGIFCFTKKMIPS